MLGISGLVAEDVGRYKESSLVADDDRLETAWHHLCVYCCKGTCV